MAKPGLAQAALEYDRYPTPGKVAFKSAGHGNPPGCDGFRAPLTARLFPQTGWKRPRRRMCGADALKKQWHLVAGAGLDLRPSGQRAAGAPASRGRRGSESWHRFSLSLRCAAAGPHRGAIGVWEELSILRHRPGSPRAGHGVLDWHASHRGLARSQPGGSVVGVDISEKMLATAPTQQNPCVTTTGSSATSRVRRSSSSSSRPTKSGLRGDRLFITKLYAYRRSGAFFPRPRDKLIIVT